MLDNVIINQWRLRERVKHPGKVGISAPKHEFLTNTWMNMYGRTQVMVCADGMFFLKDLDHASPNILNLAIYFSINKCGFPQLCVESKNKTLFPKRFFLCEHKPRETVTP